MKVRKFCFKFVDHDAKLCTDIDVMIHSTEISQWESKNNDEDVIQHAKWMADYIIWSHYLKMKVKQIIRERYFADLSETFGDYKIKKICKKIENDIINLGKNNSTNVFMQKKVMEMVTMKFMRGKKPADWAQIFNYEKNCYNLIYILKSNELDNKNINLEEVCAFPLMDGSMDPQTDTINASRQPLNLTDARSNKQATGTELITVTPNQDQRGGAYNSQSSRRSNRRFDTDRSDRTDRNTDWSTDRSAYRTSDGRSTDAMTTDRTTDSNTTDHMPMRGGARRGRGRTGRSTRNNGMY